MRKRILCTVLAASMALAACSSPASTQPPAAPWTEEASSTESQTRTTGEHENQDTTEAGLDAVKSLVWQAMAKERPDLYRQVNEFLNSKKEDGLEAR